MKITAELLELSPSFINPLGYLQLDLRGNRIAEIENLFITRDSYEVLDLSDNEIEDLENIPLLTNLKELYLCNNSIREVSTNILNLSNLAVLNLQGNKITDINQISHLNGVESLKCLVLNDNPICNMEGYRDKIVETISQLEILDFQPIASSKRNNLSRQPRQENNIQDSREAIEELIKKAERAEEISDVKHIEKLLSSGLIK